MGSGFPQQHEIIERRRNELTYLQSLVQAYYLEPETLAEELREFKADLTARYTNNEVKKTTQEKLSVLIKDILSSSGDDLAHIANNDAYFGLVATVAIEDRIGLLSEKLAMESESPQTIFEDMAPPNEAEEKSIPRMDSSGLSTLRVAKTGLCAPSQQIHGRDGNHDMSDGFWLQSSSHRSERAISNRFARIRS